MASVTPQEKLALMDRFAALFEGRNDMWGAVHGECIKRPLITLDWNDHLFGGGSIGVYPTVLGRMLPNLAVPFVVKWGCTDIDTHGTRGVSTEVGLTQARNLVKALRLLGITGWVERTKSDGFHVWVFAQDWVPAKDMRRALLVAHQVAGVLPTEVNPKQTSLDHLVVGNYVNLPWAKRWVEQGKRVVVYLDGELAGVPYDFEAWLNEAEWGRTSPATLAKAAALYVPPPERRSVSAELLEVQRADGSLKEITDKLPGLAWTIFDKGPLPGADRSTLMLDFAHQCRDAGLTPDECYTLLADIDGRWGKGYLSRNPPAEKYLREKVDHAYG